MAKSMTSSPEITRAAFERDDFDKMCLFTGQPVELTRRGEHVLPRWLIDDYELNHRRIEIGWPGSPAAIKEFRSRADPEANGTFGVLEDLVKRGQASVDQLHLWQKKISTGMTLCHWRLAQNARHPHAPTDFDTRFLVCALDDFRADFKKFANKHPVPRSGSTLVLPTRVPDGWLAHLFGCDIHRGETLDALMPFAMVAVTHQSHLIVSVLYDSGREFETSRLAKEWNALKLDQSESACTVAAALAVAFSEFLFQARRATFGTESEAFDALLKRIGYQIGLDIDPETRGFRPRSLA